MPDLPWFTSQHFFLTCLERVFWSGWRYLPPHLYIAQSPRPHFRSFVLNTFPNSLELPKCPQPSLSPLWVKSMSISSEQISRFTKGPPKVLAPKLSPQWSEKKGAPTSGDARYWQLLAYSHSASLSGQWSPNEGPHVVGTSFYRNGFLWASPGKKSYNYCYDWWRSEFLFQGAFSINGCAANIAITQPTK